MYVVYSRKRAIKSAIICPISRYGFSFNGI